MSLSREPYLSVVAAYGGPAVLHDAERFVALFTAMLATQARRFDLPLEVILVDWRPGQGHQSLASLPICWPAADATFTLSIISAEDAALAGTSHSVDRGFQERIAQNIGIRRARGRFVLAATIETILSDGLAASLGRRDLDPTTIPIPLRLSVDARSEIAALLRPGPAHYETNLDTCIRAILSASCYPHFIDLVAAEYAGGKTLGEVLSYFRQRHPELRAPDPTYGAVSYLLMAREHWEAFRGYPEWPVVDQLLDRLVLALARIAGLTLQLRPLEECYFHLGLLRPRLVDQPFPVRASTDGGLMLDRPSGPLGNFHEGQMTELIDDLVRRMHQLDAPVHYNAADWGLGGRCLPTMRPATRGD